MDTNEKLPEVETPIIEPTISEVMPDPKQEETAEQISSRLLKEAGHHVIEEGDTEEVAFLKQIHTVQNNGGFGKHLNEMINDRIKELQSK